MSRHPLIEDNLLPPALLQPLEFGNPAQIRALYQVEDMIEGMVAEAQKVDIPTEKLKRFNVKVTVEATYDLPVIATNKEVARQKAKELFEDVCLSDLDFEESYFVYEIKVNNG